MVPNRATHNICGEGTNLMKILDFGVIEFCGLSNEITAVLTQKFTFGQFLALLNPHRTF